MFQRGDASNVWKKRTYKDGSFQLTSSKKFIYVHEFLERWWIDYGINNRDHVSTIMAASKKEIPQKIKDAKSDFGYSEY